MQQRFGNQRDIVQDFGEGPETGAGLKAVLLLLAFQDLFKKGFGDTEMLCHQYSKPEYTMWSANLITNMAVRKWMADFTLSKHCAHSWG